MRGKSSICRHYGRFLPGLKLCPKLSLPLKVGRRTEMNRKMCSRASWQVPRQAAIRARKTRTRRSCSLLWFVRTWITIPSSIHFSHSSLYEKVTRYQLSVLCWTEELLRNLNSSNLSFRNWCTDLSGLFSVQRKLLFIFLYSHLVIDQKYLQVALLISIYPLSEGGFHKAKYEKYYNWDFLNLRH